MPFHMGGSLGLHSLWAPSVPSVPLSAHVLGDCISILAKHMPTNSFPLGYKLALVTYSIEITAEMTLHDISGSVRGQQHFSEHGQIAGKMFLALQATPLWFLSAAQLYICSIWQPTVTQDLVWPCCRDSCL